MRIKCQAIKIADPNTLPKETLPDDNLELKILHNEIPHLSYFEALLDDFNKVGDQLINNIFSPLLGDKQFNIVVVITCGIPEPYDAWCANFNGKESIVFNLSLWDENDLKRSGMAVIKHEVAHILLSELLHQEDPNNPLDVINKIIINEGIAHFIGYPQDLNKLLDENIARWKVAEETLKNTKLRLADVTISENEKKILLHKSNSGKYWDKYASIAGMFRVALIYKDRGANGLIECIKNGSLPENIDLH